MIQRFVNKGNGQDWQLLGSDQLNFEEMEEKEILDICKIDANIIFDLIYSNLPADTFRFLLERIDQYNKDIDCI